MSDTKFTKGPWVRSISANSCNHIKCDGSRNGGFIIASTCGNDETANAHLIAAAPEMYHEIERDIEWLDRMIATHGDDHPMTGMFKQIKRDKLELLAKARGEA